jgi:hypothetical protein
LATTVLVSAGLGVAGLVLVAGTAQAEPTPVTPTPTLIPEAAAATIVNFLDERFGFRPTDVKCPSGVESRVGQAFECQFTGPEGPYTAYMQITKVDGQSAEFNIVTRRN